MKKRLSIAAALIAVTCLGLWFGRHWLAHRIWGYERATVMATASPPTAPVLRFGFDGTPGEQGVPDPWKPTVIRGKLDVAVVDGEGPLKEKVLRLKSDKSHFLLWQAIPPFDPEQFPVVSWQWKAITLPTRGDVRTHAQLPMVGDNRNDKAVQVLVGFEGDEVINYSWDTTAPVGTEAVEWSPVAKVKTRIVESGSDHLNEWREQRVNIYEDYKRLYGKPPKRVIGFSVQTNSNHTGSTAEGMIGGITAHHR